MKKKKKPNGYWTKERCQEESLKYKTRFEFQKKSSGSYSSSYLNGWLDEVCGHMVKKKGIWTNKENCKNEALKYKTKTEFRNKSSSAYSISIKNGWLDDICLHMKSNWKRNFWNYDKCKKESLIYLSRNEFSKKSTYACNVSRKNGWLDEFFPKRK